MNARTVGLVRSYVEAWFNTSQYAFTVSDFWHVQAAAEDLTENSYALFLLALPTVSLEDRERMIQILIKHYQLPDSYTKLINLMVDRHDIALFPMVLRVCTWAYQERSNSLCFSITVAGTLSDTDRSAIEKFLATKSGKNILAAYHTDETLIAGIRAINYTRLWEHSVAHSVRELKNKLIR